MTTLKLFISFWNFNVPAILIAAILILFHYITNGRTFNKKSYLFLGGVALYLLATLSALGYLAEYYLYSAHMIKQVIILLIVPPMLLSSTNPEFLKKIIDRPGFEKIGRIIFHPIVAWTLGVGSMWVWNIPALFLYLEKSPVLKLVQMVSLLIFGLIFIYPVFTPIKNHKLQPLQSSLYLFSACVGCTVMGIIITFAPAGIYTPYTGGPVFWCCSVNTNLTAGTLLTGAGNTAVSNLIDYNWGISAYMDQQMGGLIMWVPACLVYLTNILVTISKWYKASEQEIIIENHVATHKIDLS